MFFDEIVHGTQYYRSPTPLPEEWEGDIDRMGDFNLDTFQIRINWRNNELREDEYDFSDVDRLLELAKKYNRKVVMKFLLECAPQYIFDKYDGVRVGPKGERLRGGYHGAFFGGWKPCFTNVHVKERAMKFVDKVVERYYKDESIILWNVWNEPRNRPIEECFCEHCRKAFGGYLKEKFGTVEALNKFYGATEESFENVNLPIMAHGYWDIYEFKKFKGGVDIYNALRFVYDGIRKYDKVRPIMSHIGFTSAFQLSLTDVCDDFTVSKAVDFWGTSVPCDTTMNTHENRLDFQMLNDFLRAVDKNYFVHEIYPGLGTFRKYDTPYDMNFKVYSSLASGTKGLVYWQYRSERVGHESDCSGIMYMDGTPRPVAYEVKDFGAELKQNRESFVGCEAAPADVAIVFDFNSSLISMIDDSIGADYTFDWCNPKFYYRYAHAGMYRLLRDRNYRVDYVGVTSPESFKNYKVLYFPYYTMLDPAIVPYLESFLEGGGKIIADEGFGMRTQNTWMQPYDIDCKPLMNARMRHRHVVRGETLEYAGKVGAIAPYVTDYEVEGGEVLSSLNTGAAAIREIKYGKGSFYLCSFSLGYSYYQSNADIWADIVEDLIADADIAKYPYADVKGEVYEKRLEKDGTEIIFIFNSSDEEKRIEIKETVASVGGSGVLEGKALVIPAKSTAFVVAEK